MTDSQKGSPTARSGRHPGSKPGNPEAIRQQRAIRDAQREDRRIRRAARAAREAAAARKAS